MLLQVANIDLPTTAITKGTSSHFQFALLDVATNSVRRVLCNWSLNTTNVTCPDIQDEGFTCVHQPCVFTVPAAGLYPASTYEVEVSICLSTVSASECAATTANASTSSSASSLATTTVIAIAAVAGVVVLGILAAIFVFCRRSAHSRAASISPAVLNSASDATSQSASTPTSGPGPQPDASFYQAPAGSSMMAISPNQGGQSYPMQQSYTLESSPYLPSMGQPDFSPHPQPHPHQMYLGAGGGKHSYGAQPPSSMMSCTSTGSSSAPLHQGGDGSMKMTDALAPPSAAVPVNAGSLEKQGGLWNPVPQGQSLPAYEEPRYEEPQ
ncbi:hypothetical protein HK101_006080 [Irineochytrium annulatum]|nr:hypothetical protein HK101_006080 [Irineochytrium annulatum]